MAESRGEGRSTRSHGGLLARLLGGREIEKRVDESFPTWEEFSEEKIRAAAEQREAESRIELPPHKVYISSPLSGNFVYFLLVAGAVAFGWTYPDLAPQLIYGIIGAAFALALFMIVRDGLFFHVEAQRLAADGDFINKHTEGPGKDEDKKGGFLRNFGRRQKHRRVFRSKLLQIHYQNVLRTFEQGNRRAWVSQDASIADIQTLVSQRGMKLAWTVIEVLPQLGLLGTLLGLITMFMAFREQVADPEIAIIAGFGTALGTTILANALALVLRPLYMRNERAMNEILSTMQSLMAMFILPTQQSVLERSHPSSGYAMPTLAHAQYYAGRDEGRLTHSLDQLSRTLEELTEVQQNLDTGTMARETSQVAEEVRETLRSFQASLRSETFEQQHRAIASLTESVQALADKLDRSGGAVAAPAQSSERMESDLSQLRLLTHDTLLLLEQISGQLARLGGEAQREGEPRAAREPDMLTEYEEGTGRMLQARRPHERGTGGDDADSVTTARLRALKDRG